MALTEVFSRKFVMILMLSLLQMLVLVSCTSEEHYYHTTTIYDTSGSDHHGCCCCDDSGDTGSPCENFSPSEPGEVSADINCQGVSDPIALDAEVEWQWPAAGAELPTYVNVMMTPVIAPLYDNNGDGVVNENDTPSVVFTAFSSNKYLAEGALVVVNGDTGAEEMYLTSIVDPDDLGTRYFSGVGGVALGDLEGDGRVDICVAAYGFMFAVTAVICLEADGTPKWVGDGTTRHYGAPVIADMDGNGSAEVIFGNQIFDSTGTSLGTGSYGWGSSYANQISAVPVVADLDADGTQEVIVGNAAYSMSGVDLWYNATVTDGTPAIGDFDLDGIPEIVTVAMGTVYILDNTGVLLDSFSLVDSRGGPPTIADYDGDEVPEIGVAGAAYYAVYEVDGTILWQTATSDVSSNMTGSSVFDFDGDGIAEVVYADEEHLFIFDGPTGVDRLAPTGFESGDHRNGTLQEYPSLADIDGDGSTEIVLASADYAGTSQWQGVRAIGSKTSSWMPSRPIWNQHAYSITNINDDGSVPATPSANWMSWNNFRTADLSEAPGDWLPNLQILDVEYCADCDGGEVTIYGAVGNSGLDPSGGFDVVLLDDGVPIATQPVAALASGTSVTFGPIVIPSASWNGTLTAVADSALVVEECDETDNVYLVGESPCE